VEEDKQMLLSIGMIVKNEEKRLRKCLESLKPILDGVRSELIIYDTGSTDSTVEIAKEFTDKVYQIEWRGDFAWARNYTVTRAIGRWYMYVDADEAFIDASDLIEFFNSGEYKSYGSASYKMGILREGGEFGWFRVVRLFKRDKDMRFVGKIHEHIERKLPTKLLKTTADHFGYIFPTEEEQLKKHERNIVPLLEMYMQQNPKDPRIIAHIINEYVAIKNAKKTEEFIKIGLEAVCGNQNISFYHSFSTNWVDFLSGEKRSEEVIDFVRKYFSNLVVFHQNVVSLRRMEALALNRLKRYKESAEAHVKAYELFEKNQRGELSSEVNFHVYLSPEVLEDGSIHARDAADNYRLAGEFELANEWAKRSGSKNADDFGAHTSAALCLEDIVKRYTYSLQYGEASERYHFMLDAIEKNIDSEQVKIDVARAIVESSELADCDDDYMRLQRLRLNHHNKRDLGDDLDYFLGADKPFSQRYADVMLIAMACGRDFSAFFQNMTIIDSGELITRLVLTNDNAADVISDFVENDRFAEPSIRFARIFSGMASAAFNLTQNNVGSATIAQKAKAEENLLKAFETAMRVRHKYLGMVYKSEVYCAEEAAQLAEQDASTYFAGTAYECKDGGDTIGFLRNLKSALKVHPKIREITDILIERFQEQELAFGAEVEKLSDDMADVISELKAIIYAIINAGDLQQAAEILHAFEQLYPTDPEIESIRQTISQMG
jgi:glycosyltransferase involved in cell wall biosynthesis